MADQFRGPIDGATRYCAVLGHPVEHSASPAMQNAAFAALGLNWRYLAFDVDPLRLREAIEGAQTMGFIGLNLTVPHKLLAFDTVDRLDESARRWGAVNTIRFETRGGQGTWQPVARARRNTSGRVRSLGFNTDAYGIAQSLREDLKVSLAGAKVLVLGAGGAGQVAAMKLAAEGTAEMYLVNRTVTRAKDLAKRLRKGYPNVKVTMGYPKAKVDVVMNATSLGLQARDPLPLDLEQFPLNRADAVFDMVYRPATTPLLRAARAAGCRVANGLGMLLHQGAQALEIWTGRPAPLEVMRRALEEQVNAKTDKGR